MNKKGQAVDEKGKTIIEILIAIVIFTIFLTALYFIFKKMGAG